MNHLENENSAERIQHSIRNLEISPFRHGKVRPEKSQLTIDHESTKTNEEITQQQLMQTLQKSMFLVRYTREGAQHIILGTCIKQGYIATAIKESHSSEMANNSLKFSLEHLTGSKQAIFIKEIYLVDTKTVYKGSTYDFVLFKIETKIPIDSLGYNFTPLSYQQKRSQLLRIEENLQNKKQKIIYDFQSKRFFPANLDPFLDISNNFIIEDSSLPQLYRGSPILQQINNEFYLVGLYLERCYPPIQDYHQILLFNMKILQNLQGKLGTSKAEKLSLNFMLRTGKLSMNHLEILVMWPFQQLIILQIGSHRIGKKGIKQLVKAKWPHLMNISMDGSEVDNASALFLIKANWKKLHSISLVNNMIGNEGMRTLSRSGWRQLFFMNLYKNRYNEQGIRELLRGDWSILSILNLQKSLSIMSTSRKLQSFFTRKFCKLQKFSI